MMARRALVGAFVALSFSGPAFGQDAGGEAFASYALDFCAVVVDGGDASAAHATVSPKARFSTPHPAGDYAKIVGGSIEADRDTPIVSLGPPNGSERVLMAVARADGSRCMAFADEANGPLDALYRRLSDEAGGWQAEMENAGVRTYVRAAANGTGGLTLYAIPARPGEVVRIVVTRNEMPVTTLTQAQRVSWASRVVTQCAGPIHNDQDPAPDSFAPYFRLSPKQIAGSIVLEEEDGQPAGFVFLKKDGRPACEVTVAFGGVLDLERAVQKVLTDLGAERQANGHYRLKKPKGAKGRDAMFEISRIPMLMVRVSKR